MYSRVLALFVVIFLVVVGVNAQTLTATCGVPLDQTSQTYTLASGTLTFNSGVCINITADQVTLVMPLLNGGGTITNTNTQTALPAIHITGKGVTVVGLLRIYGATIEVHGANAAFRDSFLLYSITGTFSSVISVLIKADNVLIDNFQIYQMPGSNVTGILVQDVTNAHIIASFYGSTSGPPPQQVMPFVFTNVQDSFIAATVGSLANVVTATGMLITNTRGLSGTLGGLVQFSSQSFTFLDVRDAQDISISSPNSSPVPITSSVSVVVYSVVRSSNVSLSNSRFGFMAAGGTLYGALVRDSHMVSIDGASFIAISVSATEVGGVQVLNGTAVRVTNCVVNLNATTVLAVGIAFEGGSANVAESNTIILGATATVGMTANISDFSFANNDITAMSLIYAPLITTCAVNLTTHPFSCYPPSNYACCQESCVVLVDPTLTCRPAVNTSGHNCDVPEMCTSNTAFCPQDSFASSSQVCQINICGAPNQCAGTSNDCLPPNPAGCIGNSSISMCTSTGCLCTNSHLFYPNCTIECGDGRCDYGEQCYSDCYPHCTTQECYPTTGECCTDDCTYSTDVCRPSTGVCDAAESCTGHSVKCPTDLPAPALTQCNISTDIGCYDDARCDGVSFVCPPLNISICNVTYCGDGICASSESCASCYLDCRKPLNCDNANCPGTPVCSNHGTCGGGKCICLEGWTGPSCSDVSVPIVVTHNDTTTNLTSQGGDGKTESVTFQVGISRIFELNTADAVVAEFSLVGQSLNATHETFNTSERWNTSTTLPNRAYIEFTSWIFYQAQNLSFANETLTISNYTLKNNVQITLWPFAALQNRLVVEYQVGNADPKACVQTNLQLDENSNVMYFSYTSGDASLYVQLIEAIVVDDRYKSAQFRVVDNNLQVILPHFWAKVEVDPNFSVLVDNNENGYNTRGKSCAKKKSSVDGILLAKIIAPIAGVCLIAAIGFAIIYPRVHTWYMTKKGKEHLESQLDSSPSYEKDEL